MSELHGRSRWAGAGMVAPWRQLCLAAVNRGAQSPRRRRHSPPNAARGLHADRSLRQAPQGRDATHITPEQAKQLFALVDELIKFSSEETGLPIKSAVKRQITTRADGGELSEREVQRGRGRQAPAAGRDRAQEVRPAGSRLRPQAVSAGAAEGADRSLLRLQDQDREHAGLGGRRRAEAGAGPRADPRPAGPAHATWKSGTTRLPTTSPRLRPATQITWPRTRWTRPATPWPRARPRR